MPEYNASQRKALCERRNEQDAKKKRKRKKRK